MANVYAAYKAFLAPSSNRQSSDIFQLLTLMSNLLAYHAYLKLHHLPFLRCHISITTFTATPLQFIANGTSFDLYERDTSGMLRSLIWPKSPSLLACSAVTLKWSLPFRSRQISLKRIDKILKLIPFSNFVIKPYVLTLNIKITEFAS